MINQHLSPERGVGAAVCPFPSGLRPQLLMSYAFLVNAASFLAPSSPLCVTKDLSLPPSRWLLSFSGLRRTPAYLGVIRYTPGPSWFHPSLGSWLEMSLSFAKAGLGVKQKSSFFFFPQHQRCAGPQIRLSCLLCDFISPGGKGHGAFVRIRFTVAVAIFGGPSLCSCTRFKGCIKIVMFCLFIKPKNVCLTGLSSDTLGLSIRATTWLGLKDLMLRCQTRKTMDCMIPLI